MTLKLSLQFLGEGLRLGRGSLKLFTRSMFSMIGCFRVPRGLCARLDPGHPAWLSRYTDDSIEIAIRLPDPIIICRIFTLAASTKFFTGRPPSRRASHRNRSTRFARPNPIAAKIHHQQSFESLREIPRRRELGFPPTAAVPDPVAPHK